MCPKLIELLSWNGPTVHVCCFILARVSTKTFVSRSIFVSRVQKTAKKPSLAKKFDQGHSLAEVSLYLVQSRINNYFARIESSVVVRPCPDSYCTRNVSP